MSPPFDFTLKFAAPGVATLTGVLRLESPQAYDTAFASISAALTSASGRYTLDVSGVSLMNSSGIRALAGLVLLARDRQLPLVLLGRASVPWQKKTVASLTALWTGLQVTLS